MTPLPFSSRWIVGQSGKPRTGVGSAGAPGNSRCSSAPSSRSADRGQDSPAAAARRKYSSTAGREIPQLLAALRWLRPLPQHSRKISFIFRMDNLCAGIGASSPERAKGAPYRGLSASIAPVVHPSQGWQDSLEWVAAFGWNGWQPCRGISGRLRLEYATKARGDQIARCILGGPRIRGG